MLQLVPQCSRAARVCRRPHSRYTRLHQTTWTNYGYGADRRVASTHPLRHVTPDGAKDGRVFGQFLLGVSTLLVMLAYSAGYTVTKKPATWKTAQLIYASERDMQQALLELTTELSAAGMTPDEAQEMISRDPDELHNHSYSEWSTSNSDVQPFAIVYPECTDHVSLIAKLCSRYRIPMVPYGAGSSVEGSFSSPHGGFCINFSRMNKIVALHADDMDVVVQAGVNVAHLNEQLESSGLFLPLDPSPTALIGGMIATNCSGTNAMRYGTMKDYVLNLTLVLADGSVIRTRGRGRPRKTSAGYDLTRLLVGSEGTLGMVTEATLKLAVIPKETAVATVSFPAGVEAAARASVRMMRAGIGCLAALEIMDEAQMKVINRNGGTLKADGQTKRLWPEQTTLFLKFSGGSHTGISEDAKKVKEIVHSLGGQRLEMATEPREKDAIWAARKEALWAMLAQREPGTEIWSTDVAVPLSRLAEIINISKQESSALGLFNSVLGHVGDGNFHQSVMYHPDDPEEKAKVARCVKKMMTRALEMNGTVSGEHAIGIGKKDSLEEEVGLDTIDVMRRLKYALDPHWLMNPGKVFDHKTGARNP